MYCIGIHLVEVDILMFKKFDFDYGNFDEIAIFWNKTAGEYNSSNNRNMSEVYIQYVHIWGQISILWLSLNTVMVIHKYVFLPLSVNFKGINLYELWDMWHYTQPAATCHIGLKFTQFSWHCLSNALQFWGVKMNENVRKAILEN